MSLGLIWPKAFKKSDYIYNHWSVSRGVVRYKNTVIGSVRLRIVKRGIYIEIKLFDFMLLDDVIDGKYQTLRAIERVQYMVGCRVTFNGVMIKQVRERYKPEEVKDEDNTTRH